MADININEEGLYFSAGLSPPTYHTHTSTSGIWNGSYYSILWSGTDLIYSDDFVLPISGTLTELELREPITGKTSWSVTGSFPTSTYSPKPDPSKLLLAWIELPEADHYWGGRYDDHFVWFRSGTNDVISGGKGTDTLSLGNNYINYEFSNINASSNSFIIHSKTLKESGNLTVEFVENFAFNDQTLTFSQIVTDNENTTSPPTNSAPTDITLDSTTVAENAVAFHIANISGVDPDSDVLIYSVTGGSDASSFAIVDNMLHLATGVSANYEDQSSYNVTLTATDVGGLTYKEDFTISITDVEESSTLNGSTSNDTLDGFSGYYTLDGKGGLDVAKYSVVSDAVSFSKNGAGQLVVQNTSNSSESDILLSMERIQFSDKNYALDLDGNTGIAAKAIIATFGADKLSAYMATVVPAVDAGYTLDGLCDLVVEMGLVESLAGSSDMSSFVEYVYGNVVARELDAFERGMIGNIANGPYSKSDLLKLAVSTVGIDSQVNSNAVDLIGVPGSVDGELLAYLI